MTNLEFVFAILGKRVAKKLANIERQKQEESDLSEKTKQLEMLVNIFIY